MSVVDPPLMMGLLTNSAVLRLTRFAKECTEESASILVRDLADLTSLIPDNRPFTEVGNPHLL